MNRLNLLVASSVVLALSGCSFSVAHRDQNRRQNNGCGESGFHTSHETCRQCGKKSKRYSKTAPLYPGDTYSQFGGTSECGCGEQVNYDFPMSTMSDSSMYFEPSGGCSSCGGEMPQMGYDGFTTGGGCGIQGGSINPQYLSPMPSPAPMTPAPMTPAPMPPTPESREAATIAPAPPATDDVARPMSSPSDAAPMEAPAQTIEPAPFESPKSDEFGTEPAPAPIPADPVSWQVPSLQQ